MEKQTIRIEWDGAYSLEDIGYSFDDNFESKYVENSKLNNKIKDYGLYQIYGTHPVYGNDVLLYIGKALQQTFSKRISQEEWEYNSDCKNIKIYVGRLFSVNDEIQPSDNAWETMITQAEKMLIYSHSPAKNSSNILHLSNKEALKKFKNLKILNYDNYRSLMPEVSGDIWVDCFHEYKIFEYKN
ncbi:hypothetical protein FCU45_11315 [Sulfurimonas crateris]|uniref:GIY-YIG nuclease family protein n=1 Tax=Sulfurimonas crateris TaxID=2574727 RepID=A0A4U2Z2C9_9BACT|nr:type I-C CRISPR-associated protein Cas8c/Csd1 [Sulfurimonas crateris]TKI68286.1 hypothetical protein FCU45_11315 [Sulfurimonas crateris]